MKLMSATDTIYALASGAPPCGVAVVRVSGAKARDVCRAVIGKDAKPGLLGLVTVSGADGERIDEGLGLFFAGPRSFTGEDVLELQLHGSVAVVESVLERLSGLGLRHAEPGEFTRRAFENERMDLTQIEGLSDLLAARTETQRRLALAQQDGSLRRLYEGWSKRLLHARAMIEAEFDFADEEDVPDDAGTEAVDAIARLVSEMERHLAHGRDGEIVRDGFRVALLGPPNAGKSSLLNALAQRDAAIVTDIPGTTRDPIEVTLARRGMAVVVTDTAGLRDTDDPIEREGVARSHRVAQRADLQVWLVPEDGPHQTMPDTVMLVSKDDEGMSPLPSISVKRADGLDAFWTVVDERLARHGSALEADAPLPTRARHREGVANAQAHLADAMASGIGELRAEHLRAAHHALARITGRVDVEDLLGVIFSEFCVGK